MFEIGKRYDFETLDSSDHHTAHHYSGVIVEATLPLIKVRRDCENDEIIIDARAILLLALETVRGGAMSPFIC